MTVSGIGADISILAGAVIVLGGLAALVRAIWGIAQTLRDNTKATKSLTDKLQELTVSIDGRFDQLADRVTRLEGRRRARPPTRET
jgi:hypothetical protein